MLLLTLRMLRYREPLDLDNLCSLERKYEKKVIGVRIGEAQGRVELVCLVADDAHTSGKSCK